MPDMAGQPAGAASAADWPRLAGAWGSWRHLWSGAESSLQRASWPKSEPTCFDTVSCQTRPPGERPQTSSSAGSAAWRPVPKARWLRPRPVVLWRLLSEPDHASDCLKLRPAVANQPLGTVLAGRTGLAFDTDDDPLDQVVPLRVLVPLQGRSLRHRVHPARGRRRESGALGPLLGSAPAADHLCRKQGLYGRPAQPTRHRPRHPWRW